MSLRDKHGVLYTRWPGAPIKLADMVLTPAELRITLHDDAIKANIPGISLIHDRLAQPTLVYKRDQWRHLPPQLEALLPPQNRDNPQRIILSKLLAQRVDVSGRPAIDQEWEMLLFAGRNGSGHIDAFADDASAWEWYGDHCTTFQPDANNNAPKSNLSKPDFKAGGARSNSALPRASASALWAAFRHVAEATARDDSDIDRIVAAVGPTPAISGFVPKLFANLTLKWQQWTGGISNGRGVHAIVKIESSRYPGLLALEALAYEMHAEAGLPVPRVWLRNIDFKGESFPVLAVERFDRDDNGNPLPLESVFSILRTGAPGKFFDNTDGSMEDVWNAVKFSSTNIIEDRFHLFSRFALSVMTGNGDLHLQNWSMLGSYKQARLSPVYDPAPMRAWRAYRYNHDLLCSLPFSGIGGMGSLPYADSGDTPSDLAQRLVQFGEHMGMSTARCRERLVELLHITRDYRKRAIALLRSLPVDQRKPRAPDIEGFDKTLRDVRRVLCAVAK